MTRRRAMRGGFAGRIARAVAAWSVAWAVVMLALMLLLLLPPPSGRPRAGGAALVKGVLFAALLGASNRVLIELVPRQLRVSKREVVLRGRVPVVIGFERCRLSRVSDGVFRADFVRRDCRGAEYVALTVGVTARDVEKLAAASGASVP
jgi:hypothetical protein